MQRLRSVVRVQSISGHGHGSSRSPGASVLLASLFAVWWGLGAGPAHAASLAVACPAGAAEHEFWKTEGIDDGAFEYEVPADIFPNGIVWAGTAYQTVYVNSNGSISFGDARPEFVPSEFMARPVPAIAPFMADVDFRDQLLVQNPGVLSICEDPARDRIIFTWRDVHHHDVLLSPGLLELGRTNHFQLVLQRLSAVCTGSVERELMDVEFRYQRLPWYAGTSHGGDVDGACTNPVDPLLDCEPAIAGFVMAENRSYLLPGSGQISITEELLQSSNVGLDGVFRYRAVDGDILRCGDGVVDADACETCDDGDAASGDGCSAFCLIEAGEGDSDGDGVADRDDNCPVIWNPGQEDANADGVGDDCVSSGGATGLSYLGGGCSASTDSGPFGTVASLLLLAFFLGAVGVRKRARRGSQRAVTGMVVLVGLTIGVATPVLAQDEQNFSVERFRLASDAQGIIDVEWADVPGHLNWSTTLWFGSSDDPLVVHQTMDDGSTPVRELVDYRVAAAINGSITLWSRLQMSLDVPLVIAQGSSAPDAMGAELDGLGLGDARVTPKLQLLHADDHGLHLALLGGVVVPTAAARSYRGDPGFAFEPALAASRSFGAWRVAGNIGYRVRRGAVAADYVVDDELFGRVGLGHRFSAYGGPPLEIDLSVATATLARDPLGSANQNHAEVMAGVAYDLPGPLVGMAALGAGVASGVGTPDWRAIVGVRLGGVSPARQTASRRVRVAADQHGDGGGDADGDGIPDADDACPQSAEDMDGFQDRDGCREADNDADGVIDSADACADIAGAIENRGCPDADRDADTVVDRLDNCPDEYGSPDNAGCSEKQLVVLRDDRIEILDKVYFETDRAVIRRRSYPLLENVARVLRAHPEIERVTIEGHTDNRGDGDYNLDLSQRRAESVRAFLLELEIAPGRLVATGLGETRPVSSNRTGDGRARNRRVEFKLASAP